MSTRIEGDVYVDGNLRSKTMNLPDSAVTNASVVAAAGISASKLEHPLHLSYSQSLETNATAGTYVVHAARASGTLKAFEVGLLVAPDTAAGSSGRTVTIDLQKSTAGGAFASVLAAAITLNSTTTVRTLTAATITGTTFIDGDILAVVVTVAGDTGTHPLGIYAELVGSESYAE